MSQPECRGGAMIQLSKNKQLLKSHCLSDMDLYRYFARTPGDRSLADLEAHVSTCPHCLEALAELIKLLHPEPGPGVQTAQEASQKEIQDTLTLIQQVTQKEVGPKPKYELRQRTTSWPGWYRWAAAATAAVIILGLAFWSIDHLRDLRRSRAFYAQAEAQLKGFYSPQSPSGLRLSLPFESAAVRSDSPNEESLDDAENLFHQSIAIRERFTEAHLGLGYIYLCKAQFSRALIEFQKAVDSAPNDAKALLGHGVALYENALASKDPLVRSSCLQQALIDFDRILQKDRSSREARFDKCLTLYEAGHHKEATREIDVYLSSDAASYWAERLKAIQTRIQMRNSSAIEQEVDRVMVARNAERLKFLAQTIPYQMPGIIRKMLRRDLEMEGPQFRTQTPLNSDLRWAIQIMESSYGAATGDKSHRKLLNFYFGLSPPQKRAKRLLDARLQELIELHKTGGLSTVLRASQPLEREFDKLHDHWELANVHHLRGNCFYYNQADFESALAEYRAMLRSAERSGAPDLIARALGASAAVYLSKGRFDEAKACVTRMQELAASFHLDSWAAYAYCSLGQLYLDLNQFQDSLDAYSTALSLAYHLIDEPVVVDTLENMGTVLERMERFDAAREQYLEALRWQDFFAQDGSVEIKEAIKARRANLLYRQGCLALRMKDLSTAAISFKQGQQLAATGMREIETKNRLGLAQVYLEMKDFERAKGELRPCLINTASGEFPELEWQASSLSGILSRQLGDKREAFACFERATRVLEGMRHGISSRELKYAFLNRRFDPYQELVALLFHSEKNLSEALACVNRAKSMTLREYLEENNRRLNPDGATAISMEVIKPPAGYAIVEYFSLPDELLMFVSGPGGVDGTSIPLSRSELGQKVQNYLDSIRIQDLKAFYRLSQNLYAELVTPVENLLDSRPANGIILVPDGPLHLLPFASLRDSSGRYLLEKYSLSYAPSQSILRYCLSLNRGSAAQDKTILLLDAASSLSGASGELADIARIYKGRATLVDSEDLSTLDHEVQGPAIIHFAGHATVSLGKPKLVVGTPQKPAYIDSSRVGNWMLGNTRLVWLAGCNTGIGPIAQGETCWGLVPAFLGAGAPAVVVSLMPIDDIATRTLTVRFYELLAHGLLSKAKALQQAQLSMLGNSPTDANPQLLHWIPFVLVGDPR